MSRKPTIKNNPLDVAGPLDFISSPKPVEAEPMAAATKQISVRLPYPLYERFKVEVMRSGEPQQDILASLIENWLDAR